MAQVPKMIFKVAKTIAGAKYLPFVITSYSIHYTKLYEENFVADQLKISQILINLIGNAIKFTKDGDIWVRVSKIDQKGNTYKLKFEIEDNSYNFV